MSAQAGFPLPLRTLHIAARSHSRFAGLCCAGCDFHCQIRHRQVLTQLTCGRARHALLFDLPTHRCQAVAFRVQQFPPAAQPLKSPRKAVLCRILLSIVLQECCVCCAGVPLPSPYGPQSAAAPQVLHSSSGNLGPALRGSTPPLALPLPEVATAVQEVEHMVHRVQQGRVSESAVGRQLHD